MFGSDSVLSVKIVFCWIILPPFGFLPRFLGGGLVEGVSGVSSTVKTIFCFFLPLFFFSTIVELIL